MKQIPLLRSMVAASTAGNAAAVPASVVVTAIVVPLVTAWWAGCVGSPSADGSSTTEGSAAAPTRREPH